MYTEIKQRENTSRSTSSKPKPSHTFYCITTSHNEVATRKTSHTSLTRNAKARNFGTQIQHTSSSQTFPNYTLLVTSTKQQTMKSQQLNKLRFRHSSSNVSHHKNASVKQMHTNWLYQETSSSTISNQNNTATDKLPSLHTTPEKTETENMQHTNLHTSQTRTDLTTLILARHPSQAVLLWHPDGPPYERSEHSHFVPSSCRHQVHSLHRHAHNAAQRASPSITHCQTVCSTVFTRAADPTSSAAPLHRLRHCTSPGTTGRHPRQSSAAAEINHPVVRAQVQAPTKAPSSILQCEHYTSSNVALIIQRCEHKSRLHESTVVLQCEHNNAPT